MGNVHSDLLFQSLYVIRNIETLVFENIELKTRVWLKIKTRYSQQGLQV